MEAEIVDIDGKEGVAVSLVFDTSRLDNLYKNRITDKLIEFHINYASDDNGDITFDYDDAKSLDQLLLDYYVQKKDRDNLNSIKDCNKRLEAKIDRMIELLYDVRLYGVR